MKVGFDATILINGYKFSSGSSMASIPYVQDRISKRYRCRRLNAYGIKRFRAFFAWKFTDYSIDAKRLILGIAQIWTPLFRGSVQASMLGALFEAADFKKGADF